MTTLLFSPCPNMRSRDMSGVRTIGTDTPSEGCPRDVYTHNAGGGDHALPLLQRVCAAHRRRRESALARAVVAIVAAYVVLLSVRILLRLTRLNQPGRLCARQPSVHAAAQVCQRLRYRRSGGAHEPPYVTHRLPLGPGVVPPPMRAAPKHKLAPSKPLQPGFRRLRIVGDLKAGGNEERDRQRHGKGNQSDEERVNVVGVIRKARAHPVLHSIWIVGQHRQLCKLRGDVTASACESAAWAHRRTVVAV